MSRAWKARRAALFAGAHAVAGSRATADGPVLVGRDFVASRARPRKATGRRRSWAPALAACVLAAVLLVALRVHVLRLRYELAQAVEQETHLREARSAAWVARGALRDPRRLRRLAGTRGFVRPERVIELPVAPTAARRGER